jgi:VanZ family protein
VPLAVVVGILTITSWPRPPAMPHNSDKVIHFLAYATLGASVAWAAAIVSVRRALFWMCVVATLAALDEWHQQFIPSRSADRRDWMADTAGAVTGLSLVSALMRRRELVA